MYDLNEFGLTDLIKLSAEIRGITAGSVEDIADRVVAHLRAELRDSDAGVPTCVLARFYKTHRYGQLPPDLQDFVTGRYGDTDDGVYCLTLLATAGDQREWNHRTSSKDHQAIPLPNPEAVAASPMVNGLISQLGLDVGDVIDPRDMILDSTSKEFNVFYVPDAVDHPLVPAQDFVKEHGVRSVLGFGGLLPCGEIWSVILFTRSAINREVAEFFRSIALSVSVALVPSLGRVFRDEPDAEPLPQLDLQRWRAEAMDRLLEVREGAVVWQTEMLQHTLVEMADQARQLEASRDTVKASEARKAAILDAALDGVISMGADGRIIEINPAAAQMFGLQADEVVGEMMVDRVIPKRLRDEHSKGLARYLQTGESRILNQHIEITGWHSDGFEFPVELTVTRVDVPEGILFTAYIRDLTESRIEQRRLRELADALQRALLPVTDLNVPHLDVAAEYRTAPMFAGDVGGDFYDPFRVIDNIWSVSIGDVCGKGARAAAVTNLVKHSIRSGEHHHISPADTLHEVNTLLLADPHAAEEARFCTAALVRMIVDEGSMTGQLALAGHPCPMIVRRDGQVESVGDAALPLGMFEEFATSVAEFELGRGDSLVLYTDGVTEARVPGGEVFGEKRLKTSLSTTAGLPAREQIDHLMRLLSEHSAEGSDDTAVVVLRVS